MIPHEDEAKKVHPSARTFKPVKAGTFSGCVIGWTFEVDADDKSYSEQYSWVTNRGEVSSDKLDVEFYAVRNLRAYVRSRPVKP